MCLTRSALLGILARLTIGTLLSIAIAWWGGAILAQAYLPILKWAYEHIDTDNHVVSMIVGEHGTNRGDDKVFSLTISPRPYVYVGEKVVATNTQGRGHVSVLTSYLWQPFAVALPLLLAWPTRTSREWPVRVIVFLVASLVIAMVDLPTLMWSEVWSYYIDSVAPGRFSALLIWGHLLKNGGQTLLGIVIAGLAVIVGQTINSATPKRS